MRKVRYIGGSPARRLLDGQRAERDGDPVEVSDDLGARLTATKSWEAADVKPRKSTKESKE